MEESQMKEMSASPRPVRPEANMSGGMIFLMFGFISFAGFLYAAIVSKMLPESRNQFILAIQNDRYYCLLVPLTLPILVVAVYFHWLSMKLFKHA